MTAARVSAIVRAKDKRDTIEAALISLRGQTVPVEIVVVDSGSTDGTLEVARRLADRVVRIPAAEFTFGHALNVGADAAAGEIHVALSAHCAAPTPHWVADTLAFYAQADVGATNGADLGVDGTPLGPAPYFQTLDDVRRDPSWGFSNHASSWRADVWRQNPFDGSLPSCEDKEWSWRVLRAGWRIAYSTGLYVPSGHRRTAGVRALYRRMHAERATLARLAGQPPPSLPATLREWWSSFPHPSSRPRWQRRLSPHRTTELVGAFAGRRAGARAARGG